MGQRWHESFLDRLEPYLFKWYLIPVTVSIVLFSVTFAILMVCFEEVWGTPLIRREQEDQATLIMGLTGSLIFWASVLLITIRFLLPSTL